MGTFEQTLGCLLGLSLGDAIGAPFEGGVLERCLWRVIGRTRSGEMRWTDDTQMSLDVLNSFLAVGRIDPDDLAVLFATSYRWSRGYGPGAAKVLKRIAAGVDWRKANRSVYRDGSLGNGAAMRAPIVGLIYANRPTELSEAARSSAIVTHAHPLAIDGAILIARATASAVRGEPNLNVLDAGSTGVSSLQLVQRLGLARSWLESRCDVTQSDLIKQLGNGIAAHESCVTSVYVALRFRDRPFVDMLQFITACGGDADTIGAMAGAIWGAANGYKSLPPHLLERLESHDRLCELGAKLHQRIVART